jgi:hypothetical protein
LFPKVGDERCQGVNQLFLHLDFYALESHGLAAIRRGNGRLVEGDLTGGCTVKRDLERAALGPDLEDRPDRV